MKKIIFLVFFIPFATTAFSQTVTIIDLKKLLKGDDPDKILISKSFKMTEIKRLHKKKQIVYVINDRTPKAESIQIGPGVTSADGGVLHDVNYMCRDTNYVKGIMKQVTMSGMEVTNTQPQTAQTTYTFDNKKLLVQVVLKKSTAKQSTVQLHPKL